MKRFRIGLLIIVMIGCLWIPQARSAPISDHLSLSWVHPHSLLASEASSPVSSKSSHTFDYWFDACAQLSGVQALHACNQALTINPHNPAIWINQGQELFNQGRYQAALISNQYALILKPNFSLGLANQCGILSALGYYPQALTACEISLDGDGEWGVKGENLAWNNRGEVLFNLGRYQEAISSFDRVLNRDPFDQTAINGRHLALEAVSQKSKKGIFRLPHDWQALLDSV